MTKTNKKERWDLIGFGEDRENGYRCWVFEGKENSEVEGLKRVVVYLGRDSNNNRIYASFLINSVIKCPECSRNLTVRPNLKFCPFCGTQLYD